MLKFLLRKRGSKEKKLVGVWHSDPEDTEGIEFHGNVVLHFKSNGNLIYTIVDRLGKKVKYMTFKINGNLLVTNESVDLKEKESEFFLFEDVLEIYFDGERARYIRVFE